MDWSSILVALITSSIPAVVTLKTSNSNKKEAQKQDKRSNILSLIAIDKINVLDGKLPENSVIIHKEFDSYKAAPLNGNSFLCSKVEEYDEWVNSLKVEKKAKK